MRRLFALLPVGLAAVAVTLVVAAAFIPLVTPVRIQIVTSGSMEPNISVGAVVVTRPLDGVAAPGDVILFPHPWGPATVVHRVVAVERGAVDSHYVTKGDANEQEDGWRIPVGSAQGRVVAAVPYVGYVLGTLRLPLARLGAGILILVFALPPLLAGRRTPRPLHPLGQPLGLTLVPVGDHRGAPLRRR